MQMKSPTVSRQVLGDHLRPYFLTGAGSRAATAARPAAGGARHRGSRTAALSGSTGRPGSSHCSLSRFLAQPGSGGCRLSAWRLSRPAQWLQQNRNLQGAQLVEAARQQNWDPSVQALVVFPDVVTRLNSNIRWTTDLGTHFWRQQADVMDAVQHLRTEASQSGKLQSNSQVNVTTQTEGGQSAIEIQPADPEVVYVPVYNPAYFWGPPLFGFYPPLFYPANRFWISDSAEVFTSGASSAVSDGAAGAGGRIGSVTRFM